MDLNEDKKEDKKIYLTGLISVLIISLFWVLTFIFLKDLGNEERGTLGDMFGTLNALFSGLAFAGIIFTILLQRKELKYQREELQATRKEFVIQNKNLKAQRFENTFFGLINLHNQIVSDFDYKKGDGYSTPEEIISGRDVFYGAYLELRNELDKKDIGVNRAYLRMYQKHNTDFGHYFRNLYRTFKIIHETEFVSLNEIDDNIANRDIIYETLNFNERYKYSSILRAQLSDYELFILFYNCLSKLGVKFKPLVEHYSILKTMPTHFIEHKEHWKLFETSAFDNKNGESPTHNMRI
ncbi:hypothetical protein SCB49_11914 [unidentified eubacterium SCB49]|nr:hypothetical protein SCB49_11914 [unidentified eubacterium SCB49]